MLRSLLRCRDKQDIPQSRGPLYGPVRDALETVRSYARSHGGDIQLIGVSEDGVVSIRMTGTCKGCPLAEITFKVGIEQQLKILVPGVRSVIKV